MSRSGYTDDDDNGSLAMWRGQVASAMRGRRGQRLLLDLVDALDAMTERRLIQNHLQNPDGEVCALGAVGLKRGVDLTTLDPEDFDTVADVFDVARQLAQEIVYMNDEWFSHTYIQRPNPSAFDIDGNRVRGQPGILSERHDLTPEERWIRMREWAVSKLQPVDIVPVEDVKP